MTYAKTEEHSFSSIDDGNTRKMTEDARKIWREKLAFLLAEEAKLSDPAQKFTITQGIREARNKLTELDGRVPDGPNDPPSAVIEDPPSGQPSTGGRNDDQGRAVESDDRRIERPFNLDPPITREELFDIPPPKSFVFVERNAVEAELTDAMTSGPKPYRVNVTGMGGVGKTAIVSHVIRKLWSEGLFPDGCLYKDLSSLSDTSLTGNDRAVKRHQMLADLVRRLSHADVIRDSVDDLRNDWHRVTNGRRFLLFLDNASDPHNVEFLSPLTPTCVVVVASRSVLPLNWSRVSVSPMREKEACDLILTIANKTHRVTGQTSSPDRGGENHEPVGYGKAEPRSGRGAERSPRPRVKNHQARRIAEHCDYLPLAVEIAATIIRQQNALDVDMFVDDLGLEKKRLKRLETEDSSVVASLNLSLKHLSPEQLKNWQRLSVFAETFPESAVSCIWGLSASDTNHVLSRLEKDSLLTIANHGLRRYRLHRLLRDVALAALESDKESYHLDRLKHAQYYLKLLVDAEQECVTDTRAFVKLIDSDSSDIIFALSWLRDHAMDNCDTAAATINFPLTAPNALWTISDTRNILHTEMADSLNTAVAAIEYFRTHCIGAGKAELLSDLDQKWATLLNTRGEYRHRLARYEDAISDYRQALQMTRGIRNQRIEGLDRNSAQYQRLDMIFRRFKLLLWKALRRWSPRRGGRNYNQDRIEQLILGNLGATYQYLGNLEDAKKCLKDALELARSLKETAGEARWLANLGILFEDGGEISEALHYYSQSLEISEAIGDKSGRAYTLNQIGRCRSALQEFNAAADSYAEGLRVLAELMDWRGQATLLDSMARTLIDAQDYEQAISVATKGYEIASAKQHPQLIAETFSALALAQALSGYAATALSLANTALRHAGADNRHYIFTLVGIIQVRLGGRREASAAFASGLKEAEQRLARFPHHCEALVSRRICNFGLSVTVEPRTTGVRQEGADSQLDNTQERLPPALERRCQTLITFVRNAANGMRCHEPDSAAIEVPNHGGGSAGQPPDRASCGTR